MHTDDVRRILERLREESAAVEEQRLALDRQASAYEKVIAGYIELHPELAKSEAATPAPTSLIYAVAELPARRRRPTNRHLILQVLAEAGRAMTAREIKNALQTHGWTTTSNNPMAVVRSTLQAMTLSRNVRPDQVIEYSVVPSKIEDPDHSGSSISTSAMGGGEPHGPAVNP